MAECREILDERDREDPTHTGNDHDVQRSPPENLPRPDVQRSPPENLSRPQERTRNTQSRRPILRADDFPTEFLMMKISNHVKFSPVNLARLAMDVGMTEG